MGSERGQGTVEWVGLVLLVSLLMLAAIATGVRVPGATLARALADRLLCAASLADGCGDEPTLIAAYGSEGEAERADAAGVDCTDERAGNLYLQYWTYYADSATLRGVPIAGKKGYHHDDWESLQLRIRPDGSVDQRASSHHGYNYFLSDLN